MFVDPKIINKGVKVGYIEDVSAKKGYGEIGIGKQNIAYVTSYAKTILHCKKILLYCSERNKNVLVMGDLNDNPYDRSVLNYLHATSDKNRLIDWKEIFEHPSLKRGYMKDQSDKHNYLSQYAYLYNCMWHLIPDGTIFYDEGFDLFDQFIISKGLFYGEQGLKMDLDEVKIDKSTKMANHIAASMFRKKLGKKVQFCFSIFRCLTVRRCLLVHILKNGIIFCKKDPSKSSI